MLATTRHHSSKRSLRIERTRLLTFTLAIASLNQRSGDEPVMLSARAGCAEWDICGTAYLIGAVKVYHGSRHSSEVTTLDLSAKGSHRLIRRHVALTTG